MAYFSLHAYDADVWVQEFKGLNQGDDSLNPDIRYADEALNVETPNGVLQPHAPYTQIAGEFESRVETLAAFYRRWYKGPGSRNWLVCAHGGYLYARQSGDTIGWLRIPLPYQIERFQSNVWSWITYEHNELLGADPVDVMILSNAEDGMFMILPPDRPGIWEDVRTDAVWANPMNETWEDEYTPAWQIRTIDTQGKKFGVIERFAERIWGGAIPGDPDMLMYSRPYNATDWTIAGENEEPEDGAGSIQQPSWDGDSFTALRAFGSQLIAFKEHRVWRIMGTDPGQYVFNEQYGGGAPYPNTVAVDVERIIMANEDGLESYDGMSVSPYWREPAKDIWLRVNKNALHQMAGALYKNRYYLSIPIDGSEVNNALLVFDQDEKTVLFYQDMPIETFLSTNEALYVTSSSLPGKILTLNYDSWVKGESSGAATKWMSPWMDFGYKRIQKGGFEFYFLPEVQDEAVTFKLSIQTEKKTKTKYYTARPSEKEHRVKRVHFSGTGRRFRIIIETEEGVTAPWRILGGLQLVVETDPD